MNGQLHAWYDGNDTIIAETVEEALALQLKVYGESYRVEQVGANEWIRRSATKELTIVDNEATPETKKTQSVGRWISERGKGLLCSENF